MKARRPRITPLAGRTLALIFEKPSLRTRVTFEVGMAQLGGAAVYLAAQEIGMGKRESVPDVARNLSRWVDVDRPRGCSPTRPWRSWPSTPPSRSSTRCRDHEHPCQALADFFTLWERGLDLGKLRAGLDRRRQQRVPLAPALSPRSLGVEDARRLPTRLRARPARAGRPCRDLGGQVRLTTDPRRRAKAPTSSTPTCGSAWARRPSASSRLEAFQRYQVNETLLGFAPPGRS